MWHSLNEKDRLLQFIQPALLGFADGSISTISVILAAAYTAGSHAALVVGLAASFGAAVSMAVSEMVSDNGEETNRGSAKTRGIITGVATLLGGILHTLPFMIIHVTTALAVAYIVIVLELFLIAAIRSRYLRVRFPTSVLQVSIGGILVVIIGLALGHA